MCHKPAYGIHKTAKIFHDNRANVYFIVESKQYRKVFSQVAITAYFDMYDSLDELREKIGYQDWLDEIHSVFKKQLPKFI
ncbi:MAG: hypothetical protein B6242_00795 [Anaerolineaceae bacterium 4572_78]|nr:MAG: hypothetical protein B6242_00795 [Anaerolineaceae bacterium 4572_78]